MAHGFLSYDPVRGESPLATWLQKKLEKKIEKEGTKLWNNFQKKFGDLFNKTRDTTYRGLGKGRLDVTYGHDTESGGGLLTGSTNRPLLGGGKGGLTKLNEKRIVVGKNPTNIDDKEQQYNNSTDPGVARSKKGGTFQNISGGGPLSADNFFLKATSGVGDSGEYLTKEQRISDFKKQRDMRSSDSGAEIVAAMNRNTAAIVDLIEVTGDQIKNDTTLSQNSIQAQETLLNRQLARQEEKSLEGGSNLSGFLGATDLKKQKVQSAGPGLLGGGLDLLGTGLDLLNLRRGRRPNITGSKTRRFKNPFKRFNRPNVKPNVRNIKPNLKNIRPKGKFGLKLPKLPNFKPKGFKLPQMPKGLSLPKGFKPPKGLMNFGKGNAVVNTLFAGMEFAGRKSEGQTNVQAGVGTAGSVAGGLGGAALGAKGGAAAGAAIGALFGGVGAVPGAAIGGILGGLLGGFGGATLGGGLADSATGANKENGGGWFGGLFGGKKDVTETSDGGGLTETAFNGESKTENDPKVDALTKVIEKNTDASSIKETLKMGEAPSKEFIEKTRNTEIKKLEFLQKRAASSEAKAQYQKQIDDLKAGGDGRTNITTDNSSSKKSSTIVNMGDNSNVSSSSSTPLITSATPDNSNQVLATSASVSMNEKQGGGNTVVNNYYSTGGGEQQGVNPNGVSPGISMSATGTEMYKNINIANL